MRGINLFEAEQIRLEQLLEAEKVVRPMVQKYSAEYGFSMELVVAMAYLMGGADKH